MEDETFIRFTEINNAINTLNDYAVLGDNQALQLFEDELAKEEFTLHDFLYELDLVRDEPDPKDLILSSIELYKEVITSNTPFNAPEMVVAYLLESGLSGTDAHSVLCTVQTLHEYDLELQT